MTDKARHRRLVELPDQEAAAGGFTADAAGYLASLERRRELADRRAGKQGDGVDEDAVARMIAEEQARKK